MALSWQCVVVKVLNILLDNDLTFSDHVMPHNVVQSMMDRDVGIAFNGTFLACVVVKVLNILLDNDLTFSDHVIPHNLVQALTDRDVRIALNGTFLACVVVKVLNILLDNDLTFSDHVMPHKLVQALMDRLNSTMRVQDTGISEKFTGGLVTWGVQSAAAVSISIRPKSWRDCARYPRRSAVCSRHGHALHTHAHAHIHGKGRVASFFMCRIVAVAVASLAKCSVNLHRPCPI
ncbi:hypothetical protein J6590_005692 [Homalodisca vitripennis]|nr:hypothetical protein J6590_005692 [Homalodisca vitripennis]